MVLDFSVVLSSHKTASVISAFCHYRLVVIFFPYLFNDGPHHCLSHFFFFIYWLEFNSAGVNSGDLSRATSISFSLWSGLCHCLFFSSLPSLSPSLFPEPSWICSLPGAPKLSYGPRQGLIMWQAGSGRVSCGRSRQVPEPQYKIY